MAIEQFANFAIGTVTTFFSARITGYVLVMISKHRRVKEAERMTVILIISAVTGFVFGVSAYLTADSRHIRKVIKRAKKV